MSSIIWRQGRLLLLITVTGQIKTVKLSLSKTLGTFPYYLTLLSNRSVSGLLTRFFLRSHTGQRSYFGVHLVTPSALTCLTSS